MSKKERDNESNIFGFTEGDNYYPKVNIPSGVLRIITTTLCNYHCNHCFKEGEVNQDKHVSDPDFIAKIFKYASENCGVNTARLTGGEPLMHPQLDYLLQELRNAGADYIDITTTGYFLEQKLPILLKHGVNPITITLNTLNEDRYAEIAGTVPESLQRMIRGLEKAKEAGLVVNLNLTALDTIPFDEILEVIEFANNKNLMVRICEPTYVVGADETKDKLRFHEIVEYLDKVAVKKINSSCESVDYITTEAGGRVTIMRNLCDNRYCDSCGKYLYLRLTSDNHLKPCLSRVDTEVQIPDNPTQSDLGLAFAKAISNMGKGPEDEKQRGLILISEIK